MTKSIAFYEDENYIHVRNNYPWNLFYSPNEKLFYSVPCIGTKGYSPSIYGNLNHVLKTFKREVELFKRSNYIEIINSLTEEGKNLFGDYIEKLIALS